MKANLYVVRDALQGFVGQAFIYNSDHLAERHLYDFVYGSEPNNVEKDIDVIRIAEINMDTGAIKETEHKVILHGASIHNKKLADKQKV